MKFVKTLQNFDFDIDKKPWLAPLLLPLGLVVMVFGPFYIIYEEYDNWRNRDIDKAFEEIVLNEQRTKSRKII